jgi:hypothetical protein
VKVFEGSRLKVGSSYYAALPGFSTLLAPVGGCQLVQLAAPPSTCHLTQSRFRCRCTVWTHDPEFRSGLQVKSML